MWRAEEATRDGECGAEWDGRTHEQTEHEAHSGEHRHADTGPHHPHEQRKPYWQRAHLDWKFWVGATAIAVAVVIYVLTLDLSSVPWHR